MSTRPEMTLPSQHTAPRPVMISKVFSQFTPPVAKSRVMNTSEETEIIKSADNNLLNDVRGTLVNHFI